MHYNVKTQVASYRCKGVPEKEEKKRFNRKIFEETVQIEIFQFDKNCKLTDPRNLSTKTRNVKRTITRHIIIKFLRGCDKKDMLHKKEHI